LAYRIKWMALLAALWGAVAGCRSEPSSAPSEPVAPVGLDVQALPTGVPEEPTGPYVIRAAKLERFIEYQEKTLALYSEMLADLGRAEAEDAGAAAPVAVVKRHAEAQERARRALGLTERDVRELERVVGDVISRRALAQVLDDGQSLQQLEALAARLGPGQRDELDRTLEQLRAQQAETVALSEERRKYGDANVDLVLSREEVLTRQWNHAISTFAGTAPSATEPRAPVAGSTTP
jgi:hypothetical protein